MTGKGVRNKKYLFTNSLYTQTKMENTMTNTTTQINPQTYILNDCLMTRYDDITVIQDELIVNNFGTVNGKHIVIADANDPVVDWHEAAGNITKVHIKATPVVLTEVHQEAPDDDADIGYNEEELLHLEELYEEHLKDQAHLEKFMYLIGDCPNCMWWGPTETTETCSSCGEIHRSTDWTTNGKPYFQITNQMEK